MTLRPIPTLLLGVSLTVALPGHAQKPDEKPDRPTTTATGYIPDPKGNKAGAPLILYRSEGNLELDLSRVQGSQRVIALDTARIKVKTLKPEDVILTVTGTLTGKVLAVRELTFHLNPTQMKQHEAAQAKSCRANLRQLEAAKEQWALDLNKPQGAVPAIAELVGPQAYMSRAPKCPAGGIYTLAAIGADPTCSHKGHTIR